MAQHHLRPDRGNGLQRPGLRLPFGPCRRHRRPLRPSIIFGPTRRLRPAHAAPPACAIPSAQRKGGLLQRQVCQQPDRAQRTAGTQNSKMFRAVGVRPPGLELRRKRSQPDEPLRAFATYVLDFMISTELVLDLYIFGLRFLTAPYFSPPELSIFGQQLCLHIDGFYFKPN